MKIADVSHETFPRNAKKPPERRFFDRETCIKFIYQPVCSGCAVSPAAYRDWSRRMRASISALLWNLHQIVNVLFVFFLAGIHLDPRKPHSRNRFGDRVHKNSQVFYNKQAGGGFARRLLRYCGEQRLNIALALPHIQPLCNNVLDRLIDQPFIWQAEQSACMTLGQPIVKHLLPQVFSKEEQSEFIGNR